MLGDETRVMGGPLLVSLVGFNLCTELVQLLVVALVLPPLVVLARDTAVNRVLRVAGAELAGAAALGCLADDRRGSGPVRSPAGSARAPA